MERVSSYNVLLKDKVLYLYKDTLSYLFMYETVTAYRQSIVLRGQATKRIIFCAHLKYY